MAVMHMKIFKIVARYELESKNAFMFIFRLREWLISPPPLPQWPLKLNIFNSFN